MNKILSGIFLGLALSNFANANPNVQSGIYEQIMIAVTPDNRIEAYYHELTGDSTSMSCSFYIEGNIKNPKNIPITIKSMEQYKGKLDFDSEKVTLTINENYALAGCMNSLEPSIMQGTDYSLTYNKKWIGLKTISVEKAYLYNEPNLSAKHKAYVVKDNIVAVLEEKGDWTFIEYRSEQDKFYKGWIKKEQYISLSKTKW